MTSTTILFASVSLLLLLLPGPSCATKCKVSAGLGDVFKMEVAVAECPVFCCGKDIAELRCCANPFEAMGMDRYKKLK